MDSKTLGDAIVNALAKIGYNILDADKAKIETALHGVDINFANSLVTIVSNNFPRQSMEERMAEGPIVQLLKNSAPEIASNLDAASASLIATIETALKNASSNS